MTSYSSIGEINSGFDPLNPIGEEQMNDSQPDNATAETGTSEVRKKGKKRSKYWDHFTADKKDGKNRAFCNYCTLDVSGETRNGTAPMKNHLGACLVYPPNVDRKQKILKFNAELTSSDVAVGHGNDTLGQKMGKLEFWKFNQNDTRLALSKMIIMDERPFRMVEHDGFKLFMSVACPHFMIPSRWTVARDCVKLYIDEKKKLKTYFSKLTSRISLTTDTWTSCQNLGYMVLTAHWIDQNWKLQKRVINFCSIVGHTGEIIGKSIENCLIDWGITTKIMTVTVDNASANDVGVDYLRVRLDSWNGAVLGGKYLQMRCWCHILSLIVKDGLKEKNDAIYRVRNAF